jgi:hypothetical protein
LAIVIIICVLAVIFVVCERWLGSCSSNYSEGMTSGCNPTRISFREAATRALPILLAGIGLPLSFGYPLPGIVLLLTALILFLIGRFFP